MPAHQTISVVIPMFRDGPRALFAAESLLSQRLVGDSSIQIILVDDGSGDDSAIALSTLRDPRVQVLQLEHNQGRSAARNAGAEHARGETIVFMDCDCVPIDDTFLASHLDALSDGSVASTGHVAGIGDGFWDRYQRQASARRKRQHLNSFVASGSSQNFAVQKAAFKQIGGFDTQYRHYGFEDRDLLLRLAKVGNVAWAQGNGVHHLDVITLSSVSRKMAEAGEFTSGLFLERHPDAYRKLGYAAIDGRLHPWLRPLVATFGPALPTLALLMEYFLHCRWVPYVVSKASVKIISATSFCYGTLRRKD